jgi:hypothetical protein
VSGGVGRRGGGVAMAVALALTAATAACARGATVDGRLQAARALTSQWIEARARGDWGAYVALYAPGFKGSFKSRGSEDKVDRAGLGAREKALFDKRAAALDVYLDQYAKEKDGRITVAFRAFAPRPATEAYLTILHLGDEGGALRIVAQETTALAPLGAAGLPIGRGTTGVNDVVPKAFATLSTVKCPRCAARDECACELRGDDDRLKVPLGVFTNNPKDDEEDAGRFWGTLRVVPVVPYGAVAGAVLAVVDNGARDVHGEDSGAPLARRATLVGKGPEHALLWSGDLLTFAGGRTVKYPLRAGEKPAAQYFAGSGTGKPTACRLSLLAESAAVMPEIVYGCGGK